MRAEPCSMCGLSARLGTDGVCSDCADWLVGLDADLADMEAHDPHLAALGRNVEAAASALLRPAPDTHPSEQSDDQEVRRG